MTPVFVWRMGWGAAAVTGSLCKSPNGICAERKTTAEPFHLSPRLHIHLCLAAQTRGSGFNEIHPGCLVIGHYSARTRGQGAVSRPSAAALLSASPRSRDKRTDVAPTLVKGAHIFQICSRTQISTSLRARKVFCLPELHMLTAAICILLRIRRSSSSELGNKRSSQESSGSEI